MDRELAKAAIRFLGQPMGLSLHLKLMKAIFDSWSSTRDDGSLLAAVAVLAAEFAKDRPTSERLATVRREDLDLICFEYVTG